jgi:PTS system nitrogen regulatory IIA component
MQIDFREAARFLNVDESTVQRWVRRGELRAQRAKGDDQLDLVDLLEFAAARGMQVAPEMLESRGPETGPLPLLSQAVRAGGVHLSVPGDDVASVLRSVVDRLALPGDVDRGFLHQMLVARERMGSTGVGHGIAFPHVRHPIVLRVSAPAVAVSYLASPVDFGAIDGEPVHTLFTLVSPSVRVHLHLLALLAAALHDPAVRAAVDARDGEPALTEALARVEDALARRRGSAQGQR